MNKMAVWLALWGQKGIGAKTLWTLYEHSRDPLKLLNSSPKQLAHQTGKPAKLFSLALSNSSIAAAEKKLKTLQKTQELLTPWHSFPHLLAHIHLPPPLLFKMGQGSIEKGELRVALVGSRKASVSGLRNAYSLGAQLAERGIVVVSGLARGIDTAALEGSLSVRGKTIGVVGHGLHTIYPSENRGLAEKMKERGIILSEHPPGVDPRPHLFPRRNRILSGLCQAIIIVEATKKSGALITARFALEQNREVLAVPGPIDLPQAYGPLDLIRNGAGLIRNADDVLDALCLLPSHHSDHVTPVLTPSLPAHSPLFQAIAKELSGNSLTLNQLARQLETDVSELSANMVELELAGLVERHRGAFRTVM